MSKIIEGTARYGSMVSGYELITPAQAAFWLEKHNNKNRNMSVTHACAIAHDMREGEWHDTDQGIGFDIDGELMNGQHRLKGVLDSGQAQVFLVTRGICLEAREAIDRGKMRTLMNTLQILGYQSDTTATVAAARAAIIGPKNAARQPSHAEVKAFVDNNTEALLFANRKKIRAIGGATLVAVIARAYKHVSQVQLARFIAALLDEIPFDAMQPGDRTARKFVKSAEGFEGRSSGNMRLQLYRKAQNALRYFLDGKDIDRIFECEDDLFPLEGNAERSKRHIKTRPSDAVSA